MILIKNWCGNIFFGCAFLWFPVSPATALLQRRRTLSSSRGCVVCQYVVYARLSNPFWSRIAASVCVCACDSLFSICSEYLSLHFVLHRLKTAFLVVVVGASSVFLAVAAGTHCLHMTPLTVFCFKRVVSCIRTSEWAVRAGRRQRRSHFI